ncbi:MAG TPA: glycosyltransferase family 2 protein [Chitinophagaceae bacterium]|nr:glycosyltransferase family 2 protein [Chitinophagaceae bacterium]
MMKISIVIISYNRPEDLLELAKNISSLQYAKEYLEEVIIVNNNSPVSYESVERFIENCPEIPFRYYRTADNLGVSRGRNFAIQKSSSPILVFLDDDAVFKSMDALLQIQKIFSTQYADRPTGIAAFKVYYYDTLALQQTAFPHKQFHKRKELPRFSAAYFAGCAHAIKKEVFETVGYYPETFFYGMEEYDLSYRVINAGYAIRYDASVEVLHKESPLGRLPGKDKLRGMWINKSTVAWKYLPQLYYFSTAFLWSLEYLRKTKFDAAGWVTGWKKILRIPASEKRTPLNDAAKKYLKKVRARLWY